MFGSALGAAVAVGACSSSLGSSGSGGTQGSGARGGATAGMGGNAEGDRGGTGVSIDAGTWDADAPDVSPPPRQIHCYLPGFPSGQDPSFASCGPDGSCPDGKVCFRLSDGIRSL